MTIALLPGYQRGCTFDNRPLGHAEPLTEGPSYLRTRDATRWHRPRHGHRWPDDTVNWHYWCGAASGRKSVALTADALPTGDLLCGTCEGRWLAQADPVWTFTPQTHLPPRWCPAGGSEAWFPDGYRWGHFPCLLCGATVNARGKRWGGAAVTRHRPGPDLMPPCRYHGWHHIARRGERAVCACEEDS
jgi:hypothetical protein